MKVLGQLEEAQLENLTAPPTPASAGRKYFDTATGKKCNLLRPQVLNFMMPEVLEKRSLSIGPTETIKKSLSPIIV